VYDTSLADFRPSNGLRVADPLLTQALHIEARAENLDYTDGGVSLLMRLSASAERERVETLGVEPQRLTD
jgi:hypothetical protein